MSAIAHTQAIVRGRYVHDLIVYLVRQDIAANTSTISFEYSVRHTGEMRHGSYNFDNNVGFNAIINGVENYARHGFDFRAQRRYVFVSGQMTLTHNSDGTLSSVPVRLLSDVNPGSSWFLGADATSHMSLPTIPRASTFTVSPKSLSPGETVNIAINRKNSGFTHRVTWASQGQSEWIASAATTSASWTPPASLLTNTNRAAITISVTTFSGTTPIGATQSQDIVFKKPPQYPEVGQGTPFDIRFRRLVVEGGKLVPKETIPFLSASTTDTFSAASSCNITVSRLNYPTRLDEQVVLADFFDGSQWLPNASKVFVLSRTEDNKADSSEAVSYTGMGYADWLMTKAVTPTDFEWPELAVGNIMIQYFAQAHSRGWGPRVGFTFGIDKTTAGTSWQNKDSPKVTQGTPYSQLLDGFVKDVMVEYRTGWDANIGRDLVHMYNPGYGDDWAVAGADPIVNLELAALNKVADSAPVRRDAADKLTRVFVKGEEIGTTRESSANVNPLFGHLEGSASAGGVTDMGRLNQLGDAVLSVNRTAAIERTFSYDLSSNQTPTQLFPYRTFSPGDWILVPGDNGPERARVAQVTITRTAEGTKATITTGDLIPSGLAATARKISQASGGAIAGGTLLAPATLSSAIPAAPTNITYTLDGYWDPTGAPKSGVELSWSPVTRSMQGSPISVDLYEIWTRQEEANPYKLALLTDLPTGTLAPLDINDLMDIRIRGRSRAGIYGEYSDTISIETPEPDETLAAPPTPLVTVDSFGTITVSWNGLIGGAPAPKWMNFVRVEISDAENGGYSFAGQQLVSAGDVSISDAGEGIWWLRLVGYDMLGVRGAASASVPVEVIFPRSDDREPKAPTNFSVDVEGTWQGLNPQASAHFEWDAVSKATDDSDVDVISYEVWGRLGNTEWVNIVTTQGTSATWAQFSPGEEWEFRVRAQAGGGVWGEPSNVVAVTMPFPEFAMTAPTKPTLSSEKGIIAVGWDGKLTGSPNYDPPGYFMQVNVEMSAASGTTGFAQVGTLAPGANFVLIPGVPIGATRWVRFIAVDRLGRKTPYSTSESIVVTGVKVGDLDQEITDAIDDAQAKADSALDTATQSRDAAITGTVDEYATSSSATTAPTSGWSTSTPTWTTGNYIWQRSKITFGSGVVNTTNPVVVTGNPGAPGGTGKGVSGAVVTYQVSSSGTITPTGTWDTNVPATSPGQFLWTRTVTSYTEGAPTTAYSVSRTGTDGSNGLTSYLHTAYATNSTGTTGFSTTDPTGKTYIGTYSDFTQADSSDPTKYTWVLIKGADGEDGSDGKGIQGTAVTYATSSSGTATPSSWSGTIPTVPEGHFLWTRTVLSFTDGANTTTYSVAKQGAKGDPGSSGKGISNTAITYQVGSSGTSAPSGTWDTNVPTVPQGQFLWTRTILTYTDATTSTAYSVSRAGSDGGKGDPGKGVTSTTVHYQASANGTTVPTGTWTTTVPTVSAGQFLWTRTTFNYSDSSTSAAYSVARAGTNGSNGVSVSEVRRYYQLATTQPAKPTTNPPPAPWTLTEPSYDLTKSLYTVDLAIMSNASFAYSEVSRSSSFAAASAAAASASAAQSTADTATSNAAAAQSAANAANSAAATAAGIAESKAVVLYQSSAPAAEHRNTKTLWIDTTGGANTPKRWTTGTTWVAVTDKAATDAATAAANANTAASNAASAAATAQSAANAAKSRADAAFANAQFAQTTADGKNSRFASEVAPGQAEYTEGFETGNTLTRISPNFTRVNTTARTGAWRLSHNTATAFDFAGFPQLFTRASEPTIRAWVRLDAQGTNLAGVAFTTGSGSLGYHVLLDARRGSTTSASLQIRKDASAQLANMSLPESAPVAGTWYRVEATLTADQLIGRVFNEAGVLLGELTSTDTSHSNVYAGVTGYGISSFDDVKVMTTAGSTYVPTGGDEWYQLDHKGDIERINMWDGDSWERYRFAADSVVVPGSVGNILLADGAVTAPKIVASEEMWAKVLGAHKVNANEIEAGSIQVQHIHDGLGASINLANNSVVISANERIDGVASDLGDVSDSLIETQTSFSVRPDGVYVTSKDSTTQFVITAAGAAIKTGNTVASSWSAGQMDVKDVVLDRLIFATHVFEETPAGVVVKKAT